VLSQPPSWFKGLLLRKKEKRGRKGGEGKGRRSEKEGTGGTAPPPHATFCIRPWRQCYCPVFLLSVVVITLPLCTGIVTRSVYGSSDVSRNPHPRLETITPTDVDNRENCSHPVARTIGIPFKAQFGNCGLHITA